MDTRGQHLLAEYYGCPTATLNDEGAIRALLQAAARAAGATVVATVFHRFAPQGVSGVVVVEESHLSIHTWPEAGYAAVDFFTCGECFPERAHAALIEGLSPERSEILNVERGLSPDASIRVGDIRQDGIRARAAGQD